MSKILSPITPAGNFPVTDVAHISGAAARNSTVATVNSVADLRTALAAGVSAATFHVRYHTTLGDGGGGTFNVEPIGSYVDNNGTVFTGGTLAAVRKIGAAEPFDAAWFGAIMGWSAANATTNRAALVRALEVANELPLGSIDDDEQGDNNYVVSRKLRPVTWRGVLVWGPGITIRFQMAGLMPSKPASYDAEMVCACTNDGGPMFTLYTGPKPVGWDSQAPSYPWYWKPSFAGPGVVFTRASDYSETPQSSPQFLIDGKYWFGGLGLNLAGAYIRCGSHGVEVSADYIANGADYFSGLNLRSAVLASNYGWGIYAPGAYLDLSTLHGAMITQNGIGGINAGVRGSNLALNNIEGQQSGHILRLNNAQISSAYAEGIGTCPVIQINDSSTVEAGPQPLVSNSIQMPYYYGCDNSSLVRVYDGRPVFAKDSYLIDSVAGWGLPRLADGMLSVCDPIGCPRYLWREPRSALTRAESVYWTTAFDLLVRFGETWCRALPIGTSSLAATEATLEVPRQVAAGDTALVSFGIHASNAISYVLLIVVEVKVDGSWTSGFATATLPHAAQNDAAAQITLAFKHSSPITDVRLVVTPYAGAANYGISISPVYTATIPAAKTGVMQFAIESLLANYSNNVTGIVYAEDSSPAVLEVLPNIAADNAVVTATIDVYSASSGGRNLQRSEVTYLGGPAATIVGTPSVTGFAVSTSGRGVSLTPNDVAQDTAFSMRSIYSVQPGPSDSWDWYLDEVAKIIGANPVAAYLAPDATYSSILTGWPARIGNTATVLASPEPTWEKKAVGGRTVLQNASNFWVTLNCLVTTLPASASTVLAIATVGSLPFFPGNNTLVTSALTYWGGVVGTDEWAGNSFGTVYRNGSEDQTASLSRSLYEIQSLTAYSGNISIGGAGTNGYRNFLGDLEALIFLPNHLTAYQRAGLVSLTDGFARLGL